MNPPTPHLFDPANARELCALCAAAYGKPNPAKPGLWCQESDTHVHVERRARDLIVAFRGTADLRNCLTDLDCELVRVLNFRVHRGFHEAVQAVELDLSGTLGEARKTRLWVTGHSLGGALAKLWALWAAGRGYEVAGVYTFGQPRVGDAAFAAFYDSILKPQTFRVVHADDVIPRVPWLLATYRHAGHEVFYSDSLVGTPRRGVLPADGAETEQHKSCPLRGLSRPYQVDLAWPRKLAHALPALARDLARGKLAFLDDHHISRYQALFPARRKKVQVSYSTHSFHSLL